MAPHGFLERIQHNLYKNTTSTFLVSRIDSSCRERIDTINLVKNRGRHNCCAVAAAVALAMVPFTLSTKEFVIAVMNVTSRLGYILPPSWGTFVLLSMAMLSNFERMYYISCTAYSNKRNSYEILSIEQCGCSVCHLKDTDH